MGDAPSLELSGRIEWPGLELDVDVATASRRIALVGASGSGKSSLLRCIAGLDPAQPLEIRFAGEVWSTRGGEHVSSRQRGVGWVPQHAELFPHLSALDNICFSGTHAEARRIARALDIENILDQSPSTLSGGERQRVALGRAINRDPKLLLMDEPFAALDRRLRSRVKEWLLDICEQRDLPLVIVTHDQRDVSDIADEVWSIASGEISRIESD